MKSGLLLLLWFYQGMGDEQDRLIRRVRNETRLAQKIGVNGKVKYFNPIEKNDLWHSQAAN